tara:strand:- start:717 stop:1307 length:591 start_codon:yes stop_codon:yes gene_type:complete
MILKIAVFASHNGTNFEAIAEACKSGMIRGEVVLLISNNKKSQAIAKAKNLGIHSFHISKNLEPNDQKRDMKISSLLNGYNCELAVLAGYMKKLSRAVIDSFSGKVINIHPSLLPKYGGKGMYGLAVHKEVLKNNEDLSGVTVHLVNSEYDKGEILSQQIISISENETPESLAEKAKRVEHHLIIQTVKELIEKDE